MFLKTCGQDFVNYFERKCLSLRSQYLQLTQRDIKNLTDYFEAVELALLTNGRRSNISVKDFAALQNLSVMTSLNVTLDGIIG